MPRGTKSADYKHLAMSRCRELGFDVIKHDAAEACGLLDYELSVEGIIPPWRPAQTGKTDCCATCALCWHSDRTIAFLRH
jgi:hypothetical protein